MTITIIERVSASAARRLHAIAFMVAAAAATASPASAQTRINAFGQQISLPRSAAKGTILARYYIAPTQVCHGKTCAMSSFFNFINGGSQLGVTATIPTNVSGVSTRLLINGQAYEPDRYKIYDPPIVINQPLEVQLVRGSGVMSSGDLTGLAAWSSEYFTIFTKADDASIDSIHISLLGTITTIDGTCSVPAQTVKLPNAPLSKFRDVGSTLGTQSFQIRVDNCPKGYNRVGYALDPRGGVIANAPGVLPLTDGSTASGVKIRLADDKGVPAVFGTSIKIDAYNKATGGSYAIPMQASYIKTDATVKPGTVNGAMTVLLDYQ
ncbi:hypothetical protein WM11_19975 [Burkholderia ubonensis]|uniref:fimbrial protein n=1 Tax=Burkholderia ubonensis TaxID=101571 RepID=UPI0007596D8E|nr:fimbrial protein [Burkholderia ubonensis]KWK00435.1 hypothetical protein WM11_19975 [Burkholderia ubonensis]KWK46121.1 hypothetical protein WM14_09030 [Burkholderia ubonensis]